MSALETLIGEPVTRELVDQLYQAADIMQAEEATIDALLALADDAITLVEKHDPAAAARLKRSEKSDQRLDGPGC